VDYKKQTLTRLVGDDTWNLSNPDFTLKTLSYQNPSVLDHNKLDPESFTFIDRKTLKITGTGMFPASGFCKKTHLPDLSGSGNQV
jgi:hypothetical protein